MSRRLFFEPGPAPDPIYRSHRDHKSKADVKKRVELLWRQYAPICPDNPEHFLNDAKAHFVARTWELYVAGALRVAGHHLVKAPSKGPDICIQRGTKRIWVECVSADSGTGPDALDIHVGGDHRIYGLDDRKIMLRITSAVSEKVKKIGGYIDQGIVGPNDPVAIAVTIAAIPHADLEEVELPLTVRAVFGIGDFYMAFTPGSDGPPEPGHFHQPHLRKVRGADVPTTGFVDRSMDVVSGIMFSAVGIWNAPQKIGTDIGFVQNPNPRVRVPRNLLRFRRTYWAKDGLLHVRPARRWGG